MFAFKSKLSSKFVKSFEGKEVLILQFLITTEQGKMEIIEIKDATQKYSTAEVGKEITVPISISMYNNKLYFKTV
jgi:hypothetical protein